MDIENEEPNTALQNILQDSMLGSDKNICGAI
jgi:hypothetical protein